MRLNLSPQTKWYELIPGSEEYTGVKIKARPALSAVLEDARADQAFLDHAAEMAADTDLEQIKEMMETGALDGMPSEVVRSATRSQYLLTRAIARLVIEEWEGVEGEDGAPAAVNAAHIDALLDVPQVLEAFKQKYIMRWLTVQLEKNGSAPSQNGTSGAETNIAKPARASAKSARAKSTGPKQKKAAKSGS